MKPSQAIHKLSKFLVTVLGRQPDEFGLMPDEDGYVTIKALMHVMAEESGWRHIRQNQIREVVYTSRSPVIEIRGNRVRAVDRATLPTPKIAEACPKLLYYPVRRRAYPGILTNGLRVPASHGRMIVAGDETMAHRLGRRIDPSPVILTVNTRLARNSGTRIWRYGKQLYLLDSLPIGSFSGPPPPKQRPESNIKTNDDTPASPKMPGSYFMDLTAVPKSTNRSSRKSRGRKNEWKRERRRKNKSDTFNETF